MKLEIGCKAKFASNDQVTPNEEHRGNDFGSYRCLPCEALCQATVDARYACKSVFTSTLYFNGTFVAVDGTNSKVKCLGFESCRISFLLLYCLPIVLFSLVAVVGAQGLKNTETFTKQDPYVIVTYGNQQLRTKTDKGEEGEREAESPLRNVHLDTCTSCL